MNSIIEAQHDFARVCPWRSILFRPFLSDRTYRRVRNIHDFVTFEQFVVRGNPVPEVPKHTRLHDYGLTGKQKVEEALKTFPVFMRKFQRRNAV